MVKPLVRDYMTSEVVSIHPDTTVHEAVERVVREGHVGLPVADKDHLVGFLTPKELLRNIGKPEARIRDIIAKGTVVAHPDMDLDDCARVLFRMGIKELPVVDDSGRMVGIVSTSDIIRSHIERVTPSKLLKLKETLETLYSIRVDIERRRVPIADFIPTQKQIFADELEGRKREINRGLAEPILVIWKKPRPILVDGHHRVIAAKRLGIEELDAYVLILSKDIELGLERNAHAAGLDTLADIEVNDYSQHPLTEITERMLQREKGA
ncbi:MAG: CBS domain-containing protein [Halobacteriales archaeon]|nr:CBS domain-containing protein [Halobacteriales archaeon]